MAEVEFDPGQLDAAIMERLADELSGPDGLAQQSIDKSHEQLREFSEDYDVEPIIESLQVPRGGPVFNADTNEINLRWEWVHPAADFFNKGTSDHKIDGNDVLSFVWADPPQWVRETFDQARGSGGEFRSGWRVFFSSVEVDGIDETRFREEGVEWLQRELARRFS